MLLNTDTNRVIDSFKRIIGNPNVEFYLADTLLQQGGEKGIIRLRTSNNIYKLWKESPIINSRRFLNVYIGNIKNNKGKYTNGIVNSTASLKVCNPWHWANSDAIYLRYKWVGLGSRLLTHEAGHWLGLWHTFKYGCENESDRIKDTPKQAKETTSNTCPPKVTTDTCENVAKLMAIVLDAVWDRFSPKPMRNISRRRQSAFQAVL